MALPSTWSPDTEAQKLLAERPPASCLAYAEFCVSLYAGPDTQPTVAGVLRSEARAFWRDVATLLRLESQDDDPGPCVAE